MTFKMKGNIKFTDEKYKVDKSSIHGLGAIASNPIKKGELIGSAVDGALNVYAKSNIKQGDEITVNYNDAPEYIDKRSVKDYKEI